MLKELTVWWEKRINKPITTVQPQPQGKGPFPMTLEVREATQRRQSPGRKGSEDRGALQWSLDQSGEVRQRAVFLSGAVKAASGWGIR